MRMDTLQKVVIRSRRDSLNPENRSNGRLKRKKGDLVSRDLNNPQRKPRLRMLLVRQLLSLIKIGGGGGGPSTSNNRYVALSNPKETQEIPSTEEELIPRLEDEIPQSSARIRIPHSLDKEVPINLIPSS
jgi:hypothetical protein